MTRAFYHGAAAPQLLLPALTPPNQCGIVPTGSKETDPSLSLNPPFLFVTHRSPPFDCPLLCSSHTILSTEAEVLSALHYSSPSQRKK